MRKKHGPDHTICRTFKYTNIVFAGSHFVTGECGEDSPGVEIVPSPLSSVLGDLGGGFPDLEVISLLTKDAPAPFAFARNAKLYRM